MLQTVRRFLSLRFLSHCVQENPTIQTMTSKRFFPNTMPDYDGHEIDLEVIRKSTKKLMEKLTADIERKVNPSDYRTGADGLYLGAAGIAFMYYHLSKLPTFKQQKPQLLEKALEYLSPALKCAKAKDIPKADVPSLILGNGGIFALTSAINNAVMERNISDNFKTLYYKGGVICREPNFLNCGADELFVGRAGYVLGALWLAKETKSEIDRASVYDVCRIMFTSTSQYAQRSRSQSPLMSSYYQVEYFGAAHGLCTILLAFLSVPDYLSAESDIAEKVKGSVDYLLSFQDEEGNFPCATEDLGAPSELVHWCHGAAGMIYLMAKAYRVWREPKYLESCEKMSELIWKKGLLKKGPGLCHGVAGNGYAFLLMYRLTQDAKYLHRAVSFAKFLESEEFIKGAKTPDNPYSLFEGIAGTVCFLGDVMHPETAAFPFCDVF